MLNASFIMLTTIMLSPLRQLMLPPETSLQSFESFIQENLLYFDFITFYDTGPPRLVLLITESLAVKFSIKVTFFHLSSSLF